jgi:hypothetical protein
MKGRMLKLLPGSGDSTPRRYAWNVSGAAPLLALSCSPHRFTEKRRTK